MIPLDGPHMVPDTGDQKDITLPAYVPPVFNTLFIQPEVRPQEGNRRKS